jgi:hypothetical protein
MHTTVFSFYIVKRRIAKSFIRFLLFSVLMGVLAFLSQYFGVPQQWGVTVALVIFGLLIIRVAYDIGQYHRIWRSITCPFCGNSPMSWVQDLDLMILHCEKCNNRYFTDISRPLYSGQFNIVKRCEHIAKEEIYIWKDV